MRMRFYKMNLFNKSLLISMAIFAGAMSYAHNDKPISKEHSDHEAHEHAENLTKSNDVKLHQQEQITSALSSEEEHGQEVVLTPAQLGLADIKVAPLVLQNMDYSVYAPGEIKANGYNSYLVSPRVDSIVLKRHVALGDHVKKGTELVTLFSETVAEQQANYGVAFAEWQRVQKLAPSLVTEKHFLDAKANYQITLGKLKAYGLSQVAIDLSLNKATILGEYVLTAEIDGAVLSDDFQQGQRVDAGNALMQLASESVLWVEASLNPYFNEILPLGSEAYIKVSNNVYQAKVSQKSHTIDLKTRTRRVRLEVMNTDHLLHPGLFADVNFVFKTNTPVLAVPESALVRNTDGDWAVFVEGEVNTFKLMEVEIGRKFGTKQNLFYEISGITANSRVVMQGALFVAAEIAKGGFDPHNH